MGSLDLGLSVGGSSAAGSARYWQMTAAVRLVTMTLETVSSWLPREEFTSDASGTVRGDFEDLRFALSESYENNHFYMKTIIPYVYGNEDS